MKTRPNWVRRQVRLISELDNNNCKASVPQKLSAPQLRLFIYNKMLGEAALPIHFGRNRFSFLLLQNIILFHVRWDCDFWRYCTQNADASESNFYPAFIIYSTAKLHVYELLKQIIHSSFKVKYCYVVRG